MNDSSREKKASHALDCAFCGKPFRSTKAWAKYCSVGCRVQAFYLRKGEALKSDAIKKRGAKSKEKEI